MDNSWAVLILLSIGMEVQLASGSFNVYTCFVCNSTIEKNCNDPFNPNGINTCNGLSCMKTKWEYEGVTSVSRDCEAMVEDLIGCAEMTMFGVEGTICTCAGDKCNSAPTANVKSMQSLTLMFISSLALIGLI